MLKQEIIQKEYKDIKKKLLRNKSLNLKEDLKNKLIELDYALNEEYERKLETEFPMTTTLEKEEERLENLITFIEEKIKEQKNLINDYKKVTGEAIELSYIKYTGNLKNYKDRLNNVRKILAIIEDLKEITKDKDNINDLKLRVVKNRLTKKEFLSLLYEFCLIDNLEIEANDIDIDKLIETENIEVEESKEFRLFKPLELPRKKDKEQAEQLEEEEKILTTMPKVDKIGSVVPVNVFESLQKTEEKLPDVVLPSNGLKDDQNDIFLDTKDLFEEPTKEEEKESEKK